jgi:hypothetical protein
LIIGPTGKTVNLATWRSCSTSPTVVAGNPVLEGAPRPIALIATNLFVIAFGVLGTRAAQPNSRNGYVVRRKSVRPAQHA